MGCKVMTKHYGAPGRAKTFHKMKVISIFLEIWWYIAIVNAEELATVCKALGDPTRAQIFLFLAKCCGSVALGETGEVAPVIGATAGEVCCHVTGYDKVTSTISFHLKELRQAGLITMEKKGKFMICNLNQDVVRRLALLFKDPISSNDCC
jgi:ArsR family transcriptional regulator